MPTLSAQVRPLVGDAVQHARACKKDPRCARRRRVAELQESVTIEDAPGPGNEGQAREHIDPAQLSKPYCVLVTSWWSQLCQVLQYWVTGV